MNIARMQQIANIIMLDCGKPLVEVKRNNRWTNSIARIRKGGEVRTITIAEFIFRLPNEETHLAEIIHECCHFLHEKDKHLLDHGKEFKEWETYWLDRLGNLKPIGYKRAYYTHLQTAAGRKIATRY